MRAANCAPSGRPAGEASSGRLMEGTPQSVHIRLGSGASMRTSRGGAIVGGDPLGEFGQGRREGGFFVEEFEGGAGVDFGDVVVGAEDDAGEFAVAEGDNDAAAGLGAVLEGIGERVGEGAVEGDGETDVDEEKRDVVGHAGNLRRGRWRYYCSKESSVKTFLTIAMTLCLAGAAMAADVTGKWVSERKMPAQDGGAERTMTTTMNLKAEGGKLTGSVTTSMGGGQQQPRSVDITDGKVDGSKVSFKLVFYTMPTEVVQFQSVARLKTA